MSHGMLARAVAPLLGLWLVASACHPSEPCDPGFREELGLCVTIPVDAGGGDGDGDDDDAGAEMDAAAEPDDLTCAPSEGSPSSFGASCSSDADCACPAPTCLPAPLGYCSRLDCADDPSVCPDGFTCFNVPEALQQDGVTHLCLRQG